MWDRWDKPAIIRMINGDIGINEGHRDDTPPWEKDTDCTYPKNRMGKFGKKDAVDYCLIELMNCYPDDDQTYGYHREKIGFYRVDDVLF